MKQAAILLIALYVLVYLLPLGARPLVVPDESRYAEIPREMLETGDWIVPRLNGLRYFEKPVLGYWLTALSIGAFGENAFAVRLPCALAAGLSALLVFLLARRAGRAPDEALLAAAILLTSVEFFGLGIYSVLDGPVSLFLTATLVLFFFAVTAERPRSKTLWLLAAGAMCGLAFLTKGFLAFVVPAVAIALYLAWNREWKSFVRLPWLPLLAVLVVCAPWCILIHLREPDYWHYFFWIEHIKRFASETPQHPQPFWYYGPVLLVAILPWTLLLPAAIAGLRREKPWPPVFRFALAWFAGPLLFFSASAGKIATYILPCLPPLAILLAAGIRTYLDSRRRALFNVGAVLSALVGVAAAAALVAAQTTDLFGPVKPYLEHEAWKWWFLTLALIAWALSSLLAAIAGTPREKATLFALAPVMLMFGAHFAMFEQFETRKAPGSFLMQYSDRVTRDSVIVTDNNLVHAVCWFYKRSDVYLLQSRGELSYGLDYEDSRHRLLDVNGFNELIRQNAPLRPVVLIAELRDLEKYWRGHIPEPGFKAANDKFFIATFRSAPSM